MNGGLDRGVEPDTKALEPKSKIKEEPTRARADPMSFSNILSSTTDVTPKATATMPTPPPKAVDSPVKILNGDTAPPSLTTPPVAPTRRLAKKSPAIKDEPVAKSTPKETKAKAPRTSSAKKTAAALEKEKQELKQAMARIDNMDHSDVDAPGWEDRKQQHEALMLKRKKTIEDNEGEKRKASTTPSVRGHTLTYFHSAVVGAHSRRFRLLSGDMLTSVKRPSETCTKLL